MSREQTERLVAMGQMAASMAHEIRNPLGGMELFCSLLAKELKERDDTKLQNLAEQILKGIRTVDRVIQNCLQFAREIVPQKSTPPNLREYLLEMAGLVQARANDYGVNVVVESGDKTAVEFDPFLIQQVLINLLTNATDAVNEKSKRLARQNLPSDSKEVRLSARDIGDALVIDVQDNGDGISRDVIEKIFDPFMTTKTTGTGLGLAITHAIIRAHGGEIQVESDYLLGATFRVILPRNTRGVGSITEENFSSHKGAV
jgi:signal transduction histidine kinase